MSCASTSSRPARAGRVAQAIGRAGLRFPFGLEQGEPFWSLVTGAFQFGIDRGFRRMLSGREAGADHHAAGPRHATGLGQRSNEIGDVVEHARREDGLERTGSKREMRRVGAPAGGRRAEP